MAGKPLVSIITPVYNGARYLKETIESVLTQDYLNMEYILVNDGSTDNTADILRQFDDKIKVITQKNTGHVIARNTGLRHATGEVVAFVDQDDIWTEGHISKMLPFLIEEDYDYVRGKTKLFGEYIAEDLPIFRYAIIGACLYKASILERVGLFDEKMDAGEDFDWHVRINEAGCKEKRIDDITLLYRQHDKNLSHTEGFLARGQFMTLRKKINREQQNPIKPAKL